MISRRKISEEIHQAVEKTVSGYPLAKMPMHVAVLGSVTDNIKMRRLFATYRFDTIYHAAAYKHVPVVEQYSEEGIAVNVFGTESVLDLGSEHAVDTFVLSSTDKAARPTNAMGASKQVAELILQAKAATNPSTKTSMVRFGNVLG